jgi:hypothetical protein
MSQTIVDAFAKTAAVALTLLSAACASGSLGPRSDRYETFGTMQVDQGFRPFGSEHKFEDQNVHAVAFVKIVPHAGKVAVCGAYAYDGSEDLYSIVPSTFKNRKSFIHITPAIGAEITLRAYELAEHDRQREGPDKPIDAQCASFGQAWNDSYADAQIAFDLAGPFEFIGSGSGLWRDANGKCTAASVAYLTLLGGVLGALLACG